MLNLELLLVNNLEAKIMQYSQLQCLEILSACKEKIRISLEISGQLWLDIAEVASEVHSKGCLPVAADRVLEIATSTMIIAGKFGDSSDGKTDSFQSQEDFDSYRYLMQPYKCWIFSLNNQKFHHFNCSF